MKTGKILVIVALSAFALGCGATVTESTEQEKAAGAAKMEADMKAMTGMASQNPKDSSTAATPEAEKPATP